MTSAMVLEVPRRWLDAVPNWLLAGPAELREALGYLNQRGLRGCGARRAIMRRCGTARRRFACLDAGEGLR